MARIETDPNYTTPTFSRATAATDLFKKEDVQQLAAALSTHVHGTGTGLAVAGVAPGSITSAMIADGAIETGDIAVNAVSAINGTVSGSAFATSTVGSWTTTNISVQLLSGGGPVFVWAAWTASHNGGIGSFYRGGIAVDLAPPPTLVTLVNTYAGMSPPASCMLSTTPTAGLHTYTIAWNVGNAGQVQFDGATAAQIFAMELKR